MKVNKFKTDKALSTISWCLDGKPTVINCENLHDARLFLREETILALTGEGDFPSILFGFSIEGSKKFEVPPPDGFLFSYFTQHATTNIAVVCIAKTYMEGRSDWHYSIDTQSGNLTKLSPAY
ncbi:MAG TPA: hypothetical protein VIO64_10030 [Pseudobacteroides sp.]|uniref:hypothetical protein n=1 Tax=Pseudobacteroides sp. TaxID=1968840 RepID=UPI002F9205B8